MYTQFKELEGKEHFLNETLDRMRKQRGDAPLAVGIYRKDPKKLAIVLLDYPKIPWTMADSPIICFMQNEVWNKPEVQQALERLFKDFPYGDYHIRELGVDSDNLLMGEYEWGSDLNLVKAFVLKAANGDFLIDIKDHEGVECYGCAFFHGRDGCGFDSGGCHHQIDGCLHEAVTVADAIDPYEDEEDYYDPYG